LDCLIFNIVYVGLARKFPPDDRPTQPDAKRERERNKPEPDRYGRVVQVQYAPIDQDPDDRAYECSDQNHAEPADRTQGRTHVNHIADQQDQPAQHGQRDLVGPVGFDPAGIVPWGRVEGRGQKQKGAKPTDKNAVHVMVPTKCCRLPDAVGIICPESKG
jgi:hypothetical protein